MLTEPHHTRVPALSRSILTVRPGDTLYPPGVRHWLAWTRRDGLFGTDDGCAGPALSLVGDAGLLSRTSVGLLCSVRCPGRIVLSAYDFARKTPQDGAVIIGGFHSPMERTCLQTLLARHVPVIYCPARRLHERGIPRAWDAALAEQRLLILSPFVGSQRRVTRDLARQRNLLIAALATVLFVPYALRGGNTEAVVRLRLHSGMPVCTLEDGENEHLMGLGVRGFAVAELPGMARPGEARSPFRESGKGLV